MKKIVTIGGGNGHSHMLEGIKNSSFFDEISLKSIVSMSDDGRTTGNLMKKFQEHLGLHLPPPGDLRRCLYSLSKSSFSQEISALFELQLDIEGNISDYTIEEMLGKVAVSKKLIKYLDQKNNYFFDFILPIDDSITGHKFGNILMASMYHNYLYDYNFMVHMMHHILEVEGDVIPVTIDTAFIEAVLDSGEVIQRQDNISNSIGYSGNILDLRLMKGSENAKHNYKINEAIVEADYIILSPGDLYTSTISNLIIGNIALFIQESQAKLIFVCNITNKGGETQDYQVLDFIVNLEKYLGKQVDYIVVNKKQLILGKKQQSLFKKDISVKGGDYIFLSPQQKKYLLSRGTKVVESNLIDEESLYKHNNKKLSHILEKIIF